MKKHFVFNLFLLLFLFGSSTSYASFPVKKSIKSISPDVTLGLDIDLSIETATTYEINTSTDGSGTGKSQIIALILVFFLGVIGVHRFYLGYTWQGVVQLLTGGLLGIWTLIDLIRIITGSLTPKDGNYSETF